MEEIKKVDGADELDGMKTIFEAPPPTKTIDEQVKHVSQNLSRIDSAKTWTKSTIKDACSTLRDLSHTGELFVIAGLIASSNWWLVSIYSDPISRVTLLTGLLTLFMTKAGADKRKEVIEKKVAEATIKMVRRK